MEPITILRGIKRAWMAVGKIMGFIVNSILLTVLWFTVFAIYALVLKCIALCSKRSAPTSYWHDVSSTKSDFRNQF